MPLLLSFPPSWRFFHFISLSQILNLSTHGLHFFLGGFPFPPDSHLAPALLPGTSSFYPDSLLHRTPSGLLFPPGFPPPAPDHMGASSFLLDTRPLPRAPWREYLFLLFRLQDTSVFRKPPSRFFDDSCSPKFGQGAKSCLPKMRSDSATSRCYSWSRPER